LIWRRPTNPFEACREFRCQINSDQCWNARQESINISHIHFLPFYVFTNNFKNLFQFQPKNRVGQQLTFQRNDERNRFKWSHLCPNEFRNRSGSGC
jgi:hypothetical protein